MVKFFAKIQRTEIKINRGVWEEWFNDVEKKAAPFRRDAAEECLGNIKKLSISYLFLFRVGVR